MTYEQQLQMPEWKAKRQEIIARDNFRCQRCFRQDGLQVHHTKYIAGRMAWDYENEILVTLCAKCHADEHGQMVDESKINDRRYEDYDFERMMKRPRETSGMKHISEAISQFLDQIGNG